MNSHPLLSFLIDKYAGRKYYSPMKEVDIRLDPATVVALNRKKRQLVLQLRGKDSILKHAASDFLEKLKMHDRRKAV